MKIPPDTNGARILSMSELCELIGQSRMTVWRMRRDGLLPAPVRLGKRSVGFLESDIAQWLEERKAP
jgi:prophage regulatory protein